MTEDSYVAGVGAGDTAGAPARLDVFFTSATVVVFGWLAAVSLAPAPSGILAGGGLAALLALVVAALVLRRDTDLAMLLGTYYLLRFPLIYVWSPATYVGDVVTVVVLVALVDGWARGTMRPRWFDWLALGLAAWLMAWSHLRGVPVVPAAVQLRALFGLYPVYVYFRETGFPEVRGVRFAARTYVAVVAVVLAAQASVEKITHKALGAVTMIADQAHSGAVGPNNFPRSYGLTANPNTVGATAVLLIVLVVVMVAGGWDRRRARWVLAALVVVVVLTVSRSAAIALAVVVVAMAVFDGVGPLRRRAVLELLGWSALVGALLAACVVAIAVAIGPPVGVPGGAGNDLDVYRRFFVGSDDVGLSVQEGRLYTIRTALRIVSKEPLTAVVGQGLGTFGGAGSNFWRSPLYDRYAIRAGYDADLMYATLLVETGLVGLLGVLLLVVLVARAGPAPRAVRWAVLASFVTWGLFYSVFEMHIVYYLVLLELGTGLTALRAASTAGAQS